MTFVKDCPKCKRPVIMLEGIDPRYIVGTCRKCEKKQTLEKEPHEKKQE